MPRRAAEVVFSSRRFRNFLLLGRVGIFLRLVGSRWDILCNISTIQPTNISNQPWSCAIAHAPLGVLLRWLELLRCWVGWSESGWRVTASRDSTYQHEVCQRRATYQTLEQHLNFNISTSTFQTINIPVNISTSTFQTINIPVPNKSTPQ